MSTSKAWRRRGNRVARCTIQAGGHQAVRKVAFRPTVYVAVRNPSVSGTRSGSVLVSKRGCVGTTGKQRVPTQAGFGGLAKVEVSDEKHNGRCESSESGGRSCSSPQECGGAFAQERTEKRPRRTVHNERPMMMNLATYHSCCRPGRNAIFSIDGCYLFPFGEVPLV